MKDSLDFKNHEYLELHALNVEFGNWNEIRSPNQSFRLIYDMGADLTWNGAQIIQLVQKANMKTNNIHVILSHWDLDHIHAVLGMFDSEIQNIETFTAPSKFSGTATSLRIWNRLVSNGVNPWLIPPMNRVSSLHRINLLPCYRNSLFTIYRSTDGSSMNQSGIVLLINGPNCSALLTGDHHYPEILRDIILTQRLTEFEIIVPHHCGNAGNFDVSAWSTLNIRGSIISTLTGRYRNVPKRNAHNFFSSATINFDCTECHARDIVHFI